MSKRKRRKNYRKPNNTGKFSIVENEVKKAEDIKETLPFPINAEVTSFLVDAAPKENTSTTKKTTPTYTFSSPTYTYKGQKNQTVFSDFVDLCKLTQEELKDILPEKLLGSGYGSVAIGDGYIYAEGNIPILLTAHMDTVHKFPVRDFYEYVDKDGQHIISSPQGIGGDDRCGIYMILEIIKDYKPYILFCEDEESGGIGSDKFCNTKFIDKLSDMKYLIELDRANANDAVFYDCDNPEFTKFILDITGYKEAIGSFSDISTLAPVCGVAAVNLSCGYYNAHRLSEEVNVEEMLNTISVVKKLLTTECEQFKYIKAKRTYYGSHYNHWEGWDDWDYGYTRTTYSTVSPKSTSKVVQAEPAEEVTVVLVVYYYDFHYNEIEKYYMAPTEEEAWLQFFKENGNVCWNDVFDYDIDYM